jgi:hypothetical protein
VGNAEIDWSPLEPVEDYRCLSLSGIGDTMDDAAA